MTGLPVLSGREVIAALGKAGFEVRRQRGSHVVLRRLEPATMVVVPDHPELDRGTLRAILRQAGLTIEQFNQLLRS
ncbi:MAG: type II toxin-antitoxin system HicA family toxin [Desulfarculus sp.]|nr:type II toxin-antitoxin system HicA family toxin [Desulfarculus sp.]